MVFECPWPGTRRARWLHPPRERFAPRDGRAALAKVTAGLEAIVATEAVRGRGHDS